MNIIEYNAAWQYPARTEYAAYIAAKHLANKKSLNGITYIAYPWATLIDSFQSSRIDRWEILQLLECCLPKKQFTGRVVTTCQHIYALNYIHLFNQLGVTDLFFPHKLISHILVSNIRIHPFPLFPVQASPPGFMIHNKREYLASFVGAYNKNVYLTDIREHIFNLEGKDPLLKIIKRDAWHYDRTVYGLQMQGQQGCLSELEQEKNNQYEYTNVLSNSVFSLCPSGSGPNSIRLFEAMSYGSIPVILASDLDLTYLHNEIQDIILSEDDTPAGLQRSLDAMRLAGDEGSSKLEKKSKTLVELRGSYEPMGYSHIMAKALAR